MIDLVEPVLSERERDQVTDVLADGQLADGSRVRAFEDEFADYCGCEHAVATANGTAALHAALVGAGVGPGDTVVTSPFTFVATANAIRHVGAEPMFVDVDPTTFNLDVDAFEAFVRERGGDVDAVVPVHLFGLPADMGRLGDLCDQYDVTVVEDACQAHGATVDGEPVGTHGRAGCFSFYPSKNMTTGEGGMVTTDDADVAARVRRFVDHGRDGMGRFVETGHNFRMTSLAAAIGIEQLRRLPEFNERRRTNAATLTERLARLPIRTPRAPDDRRHVYNQYTVLTDNREALADHLERRGIDSGVYYPRPVHREPAFEDVDASCRVAERLSDEVLSLPVHPALDDREARAVAEAVRGFYRA